MRIGKSRSNITKRYCMGEAQRGEDVKRKEVGLIVR